MSRSLCPRGRKCLQTFDARDLVGETFVIGGVALVAAGVFLDHKRRA